MMKTKESHEIEILIVDDEPDLRDALAGLFQSGNYTVASAQSAAEAIELIQRNRPSLIFCDISMPGKSGLDLLGELRRLGSPCAVVMLTAYLDHPKVLEALRLGAVDYVTKPFDPRRLLDRTTVWLELGVRLRSLADSQHSPTEFKDRLRMIDLFRVKNNLSGGESSA